MIPTSILLIFILSIIDHFSSSKKSLSYNINYMDQKSQSNTQPESTPKRTKWDTTPLVKHDLNNDPRRMTDRTPMRSDQTPSRFS